MLCKEKILLIYGLLYVHTHTRVYTHTCCKTSITCYGCKKYTVKYKSDSTQEVNYKSSDPKSDIQYNVM